MKRTLVLVVAAVVGFAAAANAGTVTLISTNTGAVAQNSFLPGETIVLQVNGNPQGAASNAITGRLLWPSAGGVAFAATQTPMFSTVSPLLVGAGFGDVMNQIEPGGAVQPLTQNFVGTVSLIAGALGTYTVSWQNDMNFFGVGYYAGNPAPQHTFTIIPEPATAALVGLGLIGLVLGGRRRA